MALSQSTRKRTATFGAGRFPMPDLKHARLALADLPKAKNITPAEQQMVRARAQRMLAASRAVKP